MYKDLAKEIFKKLLEENLIKVEVEEEALKTIERELNNNLGLEGYYTCALDGLENYISCAKKVKYKGKILEVENYYTNGDKLIIENNNKEYTIYNLLGLYIIEELEEDLIQVFNAIE